MYSDKEKGSYALIFISVAVILLVIVIIILIKPALLGYKISSQFEKMKVDSAEIMKTLDVAKSDLLVAETNLESCQRANKENIDKITQEKNNTLGCLREKDELESEFAQLSSVYSFNLTNVVSDYEGRKESIEIELSQDKERLAEIEKNYNLTLERKKEIEIEIELERKKNSDLQKSYNLLLENSANNICCKAKVDNKDIDSYAISNNKVVCSVGEMNKISC